MNGFERLKERLTAEGWFVAWNMPCCQTCAWEEVPLDADHSKVLFNHSQDCEIHDQYEEECAECAGEGLLDDDEDCPYCNGEGYIHDQYDELDYEPDLSVEGFACMPPEIAGNSLFCFDGSDEGVENLKEVLPIIEECGCTVNWNGSGDSRIEIFW